MPYRDVMRVIAQDHDWFVLEIEPDVGRVFDLPRRRLFAPTSLVSIMSKGSWREFSGDPDYVFDALSDAEDVASTQMSLTREGFTEPSMGTLSGGGMALAAPARAEHLSGRVQGVPPEPLQSRGSAAVLVGAFEYGRKLAAAASARLRRAHSSSMLR